LTRTPGAARAPPARYGWSATKSRWTLRATPTASSCALSVPTARLAIRIIWSRHGRRAIRSGRYPRRPVGGDAGAPDRHGFRLAHQGYEVAVNVFTESEAHGGAVDADQRPWPTPARTAVPDAGARGVDRGRRGTGGQGRRNGWPWSEAMKMQNVLRAERDGTVKKIHVAAVPHWRSTR